MPTATLGAGTFAVPAAVALLGAYFDALAKGDPGSLPLAPGARYTENGQEIAFGTGVWATVTDVTADRAVQLADPRQGQQGPSLAACAPAGELS
jgi:hypothetical protein